MEGSILIFGENAPERQGITDLLGSEGIAVRETSSVLEAIHILKNNDIRMVIVSQQLNDTESAEFKTVVEAFSPGTTLLTINPVSNGNGGVNLSPDEFTRFLRESLKTENSLNDRLKDFREFFLSFTDRLIQIFGVNDRYFSNKDHLVARLSRSAAKRLGLDDEVVDTIQLAALLKDIGMLSIQQQILDERKKLNTQELVPVKKHPLKSVQVLKQIRFPWNVDAIILQHHENYDGSGYPLGLKGRQICVGARIVHIADSYVAMTADRPYRSALSKEDAMSELIRNAGTQFDPEIVEIFQPVINEELPHNGRKRTLLVLEREPSVTPLIKLGMDVGKFEIMTSDSTIDTIRMLRRRMPSLIIVDVDTLRKNAFVHFFNAMYEMPSMQECSFIFLVPDPDYPRHFKGENIRYLTKPVDADELFSSIEAMMPAATEHEADDSTKGLRGSLEDFSLTDIIQILHLGLKTAFVEISTETKWGRLYFTRGNIVHASTSQLTGKEALFEMIGWTSGSFSIQHGITAEKINVTTDTMHLLLEATKLVDEVERKRQEASRA